MSSCYLNACVAAEDMEHVYIIDSRSLSTGIAHLVLDAALMAAQGYPAAEIVQHLETKKEKLDVSEEIKSIPLSIDGIGHMGKKSGLEELPEVIEIICNR